MSKSQSTEDYLKSINRLQKGGKSVTTSDLAKHLKIGDGSVTDMMKKLSARKLIEYIPYKGVLLTEAGKRLALQMVRRHRLWEMFLVKFLGYKWNEIHDEAEKLEHVTSDEMERRLDRALGFPKLDPHGDPIPNMNGELKSTHSIALADVHNTDTMKIIRVSDDDPEILQHASELGLSLNKKIKVKRIMKFDGSMIVKVGTKEQFISQQVAKAIFVEEP